MKRVVHFAAGITVVFAMMSFTVFAVMGGRALASRESAPPKAKAACGVSAVLPKTQPAGLVKTKEAPGADARQSTTTTVIKADTEIADPTSYPGNVKINEGITYTIESSVFIDGDLYVEGTVSMHSGSLFVNGDIWVNGVMVVSGIAKVTVNKADGGGVPGKYGGSLIVDNAGKLYVSGSAAVTVNYAKDGGVYIQNGASIRMDSANASITDNNYYRAGGVMNVYSAGTLTVCGDFIQPYDENAQSDAIDSFAPSAAFNVVLKGTAATPRTVYFSSPNCSYFTGITTGSVVFDPESVVSLCRTSGGKLNFGPSTVILQGALAGGCTLTISAYMVIPAAGENSLEMDDAALTVNGEFVNDVDSSLLMTETASKIVVNGPFSTYGDCSSFYSGSLEVNGDFYQFGPDDYPGAAKDSFCPGQDFVTKISGSARLFTFSNPKESYFTKIKFGAGATLASNSVVSVKDTLSANTGWAIPMLYFRGSLSGHALILNGNMVIPDDTSLTVGGGRLTINGNLCIYGCLRMADPQGVVDLSGSLKAYGESSSGIMTAGRLYIGGDFAQSGEQASDSFLATGSHMTVFDGNRPQKVTFATPTLSKFASVVILNDQMDPGQLKPANYGHLYVTGTSLSGISVSAGSRLVPAYSPNRNSYLLILPEGAGSVTITPRLPARYGQNSYLTAGGGTARVTSVTVGNVPAVGSVTATIAAHAWSGLASKTYTFKVERLNPYLAGLGALPAGSAAQPGFMKTTTDYTVYLPETAASFIFTPKAASADSTLAVYPHGLPGTAKSVTVSLGLGGKKTYDVCVTAQDKSTKKVYKVTFTRRNPVSGISASKGTLKPAFAPGTSGYVLTLPANVSSVAVSAIRNAADCSALKINGAVQPGDRLTVSLKPGETKKVTITALDKPGKSITTYTVTVKRLAASSVTGECLRCLKAASGFRFPGAEPLPDKRQERHGMQHQGIQYHEAHAKP